MLQSKWMSRTALLALLATLPVWRGIATTDGAAEAAASHNTVEYFPAAEVGAAFAKGGVLVGGSSEGSRNFMVHASRRDVPGEAEVHLRDADIVYVVDGTATLVTGGSVVDGRSTASEEVRGPAITGGETRRLRRGDVLVIPAGVPHWFSEVPAPFTYFVVKVR